MQIPLRVVIRDRLFAELSDDDKHGYDRAFEESVRTLRRKLEGRMKWNIAHGTPSFVLNFMAPHLTAMGRFQPRFDIRHIGTYVTRLNEELEGLVSGYANAYILDVDQLSASFGRRFVQDDAVMQFNHGALAPLSMRADQRIEPAGSFGDIYDFAPGRNFRRAVLAELGAMHRTFRQTGSVKLVVADRDDTLWHGVSGDTEDSGLHMVSGWPIGVIEALRFLRKRGVLLAMCRPPLGRVRADKGQPALPRVLSRRRLSRGKDGLDAR